LIGSSGLQQIREAIDVAAEVTLIFREFLNKRQSNRQNYSRIQMFMSSPPPPLSYSSGLRALKSKRKEFAERATLRQCRPGDVVAISRTSYSRAGDSLLSEKLDSSMLNHLTLKYGGQIAEVLPLDSPLVPLSPLAPRFNTKKISRANRRNKRENKSSTNSSSTLAHRQKKQLQHRNDESGHGSCQPPRNFQNRFEEEDKKNKEEEEGEEEEESSMMSGESSNNDCVDRSHSEGEINKPQQQQQQQQFPSPKNQQHHHHHHQQHKRYPYRQCRRRRYSLPTIIGLPSSSSSASSEAKRRQHSPRGSSLVVEEASSSSALQTRRPRRVSLSILEQPAMMPSSSSSSSSSDDADQGDNDAAAAIRVYQHRHRHHHHHHNHVKNQDDGGEGSEGASTAKPPSPTHQHIAEHSRGKRLTTRRRRSGSVMVLRERFEGRRSKRDNKQQQTAAAMRQVAASHTRRRSSVTKLRALYERKQQRTSKSSPVSSSNSSVEEHVRRRRRRRRRIARKATGVKPIPRKSAEKIFGDVTWIPIRVIGSGSNSNSNNNNNNNTVRQCFWIPLKLLRKSEVEGAGKNSIQSPANIQIPIVRLVETISSIGRSPELKAVVEDCRSWVRDKFFDAVLDLCNGPTFSGLLSSIEASIHLLRSDLKGCATEFGTKEASAMRKAITGDPAREVIRGVIAALEGICDLLRGGRDKMRSWCSGSRRAPPYIDLHKSRGKF